MRLSYSCGVLSRSDVAEVANLLMEVARVKNERHREIKDVRALEAQLVRYQSAFFRLGVAIARADNADSLLLQFMSECRALTDEKTRG